MKRHVSKVGGWWTLSQSPRRGDYVFHSVRDISGFLSTTDTEYAAGVFASSQHDVISVAEARAYPIPREFKNL